MLPDRTTADWYIDNKVDDPTVARFLKHFITIIMEQVQELAAENQQLKDALHAQYSLSNEIVSLKESLATSLKQMYYELQTEEERREALESRYVLIPKMIEYLENIDKQLEGINGRKNESTSLPVSGEDQ